MRLVSDESNDHAVKVEEEHDEVKAQLYEGFLDCVAKLAQAQKSCGEHNKTCKRAM
jgi:hypothetical protein